MPLTPEQKKMLDAIRLEWNRAEEDIKLAEQVCNEIVFPSINELRYAGRRVVEILYGILNGSPADEIDGLLADARFDCHRARHDAIDTATAKIAIHVETMTEKLKYEAILPAFADFPTLVKALGEIRKKVSVSRRARENREAIYSAIEAADFPALVEKYRSLCANEPIMRVLAKRNRWRDFFGFWGFIVGAVALILSVLFFFLTKQPCIEVTAHWFVPSSLERCSLIPLTSGIM